MISRRFWFHRGLDDGPSIQGFFGASGSGVFGSATLGGSPNNFGIEIVVNPDMGQPDNIFFTGTGTDLSGSNGLIFEIRSGNWSVAIPRNDWIGAIAGTGQPVLPGWTSLAVIRNSGVSTLYINGVAQPRTSTATPLLNNGVHLGVTPGGGSHFRGALDELRVFTFDPLTDSPASTLNVIPEPSSSLFVGLGALGLVARRRRHC
jgi:hypothetical protein